jgi:hypothetical protein
MENGNEIWTKGFLEFLQSRFAENGSKQTVKVYIRFSGSIGSQMQQGWQ